MQGTTSTGVTRSPGGRPAAGLAAAIRSGIAAGRYQVGQFVPSVRELSWRHSVAGETARRALKSLEVEGLLSAEPRHGYRVIAQPEQPDRTLPISYLLSGVEGASTQWSDLHQMLLVEFQRLAAEEGRSLVSVSYGRRPTTEVVEQIRAARVCGVVVDSITSELQEIVGRAGLPTVLVDFCGEELPCDAVGQDGYWGGVAAVSYLLERGHRKIAWIGPQLVEADDHVGQRLGGSVGALARAGLRLQSNMIIEAPYRDAAAFAKAARALLSRKDPPTAVVALWRHAAVAVGRAARELGLVIGKDLDLVGWCTAEAYESTFVPSFPPGQVPPAMVWSVAEMVRAAHSLLEMRRANPDAPPKLVIVRPQLRTAADSPRDER